MKKRMSKEDYSVFLKQIEEEKRESSSLTKTLVVLILILSVLVVCFLSSIKDVQTAEQMFGRDSLMTKIMTCIIEKRNNRKKMNFSLPFFGRRQNVLLLGVDSNGSDTDPWRGTRSDTIILMSIDARDHSVKAISIPRDSKVYIAGDNSVQKINAAHSIGGVDM